MADQMRTSWEKLVQHVGTNYCQDIINDLNRKIKVNLVTPVHSTEVWVRYATLEALVHTVQSNVQAARWAQASMLRAAATADPSDVELQMKIAILDNEIAKGDYDFSNKIPIEMLDSENTSYGN